MNGDCARRARRRAISVLPTPAAPSSRLFGGATSPASSGASFWRRPRLRNAMATARLALCWPTTYLSSSATIWRGVSASTTGTRAETVTVTSELLDHDVGIGVDAQPRGNRHRLLRDRARIQRAVLRQRAGG